MVKKYTKNKITLLSITTIGIILITILITMAVTDDKMVSTDETGIPVALSASPIPEPQIERNAMISLVPIDFNSNDTKVGSTYQVDLMILADNYMIVGTDLIISYDPEYVEVSIDTDEGDFDLYPISKIEDFEIRLSAIMDIGNTITEDITLGALNITPLKVGTSELNIQFATGSTIDTNVVESITSIDRLGSVTNLKLNVTD